MTAPVHVTLPLPALSTLTGRNLAPGYCPACLDLWHPRGPASADGHRMHVRCGLLLKAIHDAPPAELEDVAA